MNCLMANNDARQTIMQSIRAHLAESARVATAHVPAALCVRTEDGKVSDDGHDAAAHVSPVTIFRERLESVGGRCTVVHDESEAARALAQIISELREGAPAMRVALSDAPVASELTRGIAV